MSKPRVWILFHAEVYLKPGEYGVDEMILFVGSSKRAAERHLRNMHVEPGTWWRLESARVDEVEGFIPGFTLYSRGGRVLKAPPVKQGYRAAILRYRRDLKRAETFLERGRREGLPGKVLRIRAEAVRSIRAALSGHSL